MSTESQPKKGYKTSEFWLTVGAFVLSALFASDVIPTESHIDKVAAIVGTLLTSMGYTVSRSIVKK